jgi:hypothetical protein
MYHASFSTFKRIAYVAISHVKQWSGFRLMFKHGFLHAHLQRPNITASMSYIADNNQWRQQLPMIDYQDYGVNMREYEQNLLMYHELCNIYI